MTVVERRSLLLVLSLALAVFCLGCVAKPKQAYTADQLWEIGDLKEVMRVQAHTMDPWFAKREQASFTDKECDTLGRAARMLTATAANLHDRFSKGRPRGFADLAQQLGTGAKQLHDAARSKAAAEIRSSLSAMRTACRSCHSQYK